MRQLIIPGLVLTVLLSPVNGSSGSDRERKVMIARGTFEVELTPAPPEEGAGPFQRLLIAKKFTGDLEGVSEGQMMGASTAVEDSRAYVAFELVTGALHGKEGTFMLQHKGTMTKDSSSLDVSVVPDSGTGELTGIAGTMKIIIEGKKHSYELEYTIGES